MCGMATFTIDVSMSSSTAASVTAMPIRYLCLYRSSACGVASAPGACASRAPALGLPLTVALIPSLPLRYDVSFDRHARSEWPIGAAALRHGDTDGHPLHDLR